MRTLPGLTQDLSNTPGQDQGVEHEAMQGRGEQQEGAGENQGGAAGGQAEVGGEEQGGRYVGGCYC